MPIRMTASIRHLIFFLSILSIDPCLSQPSYKRINGSEVKVDILDKRLRTLLDSAEVTGASISIIQNGAIVHTLQHGVRSGRTKEPIDSATVFYTASLTKPVFSYIVLKLSDEGLIDPDASLNSFGAPNGTKVTAKKILSHSAGGSYKYSNENYSRLGSHVELQVKAKLEALAKEKVFQPLKMNRSSFTWKDEFEADHAEGHNSSGMPTGAVKSRDPGAAASMLSTANDYARFLIFIDQRNSLSRKLRRAMFSPHVKANTIKAWGSSDTIASEKSNISWGLGLGILETRYGRAYWHAGHHVGWRNYFILYPRKRTGIVIMSNSENLEKVAKQILYETIGDVDSPMDWIRWE